MSYDLFLTFKRAPLLSDLQTFLTGRGRYTMSGDQAFYNNPDSGVYFDLTLAKRRKLMRQYATSAAFNINYCRPTFFAEEARIELVALTDRFPCSVEDPQIHGMGEGEFSSDGFVRGWKEGNSFGIDAVSAGDSGMNWASMPSDKLTEMWHWNYNLESRRQSASADQFVPTIMAFQWDDSIYTVVVWSEGLPIILPRVDYVLLVRPSAKEMPEVGRALWEEVALILKRGGFNEVRNEISIQYDELPPEVAGFFNDLQPLREGEITRLSADQLIDAEFLPKG